MDALAGRQLDGIAELAGLAVAAGIEVKDAADLARLRAAERHPGTTDAPPAAEPPPARPMGTADGARTDQR